MSLSALPTWEISAPSASFALLPLVMGREKALFKAAAPAYASPVPVPVPVDSSPTLRRTWETIRVLTYPILSSTYLCLAPSLPVLWFLVEEPSWCRLLLNAKGPYSSLPPQPFLAHILIFVISPFSDRPLRHL